MEQLLFGISGLPIKDGKGKFDYASGIKYLKSIELDAMELLFVRSVNVTDQNKEMILKAKLVSDIYLSAHGSHYINLNADEMVKQDDSLSRIEKAARGLALIHGRSLVFHPGYYMNDSKEVTFETIKTNLSSLPYRGIDYRLETTGKGSQFGTIQKVGSLVQSTSLMQIMHRLPAYSRQGKWLFKKL